MQEMSGEKQVSNGKRGQPDYAQLHITGKNNDYLKKIAIKNANLVAPGHLYSGALSPDLRNIVTQEGRTFD